MKTTNKSHTVPPRLVAQTPALRNNSGIKEQLTSYFKTTFEAYEKLFEILDSEEAYYIRAQPLRHPLIFYYGHTAAFFINKLIDAKIIKQRVNPRLEGMFAVGVDEMDWDDLDENHYDWPSVSETREYRQEVRKVVLKVLEDSTCNQISDWFVDLWMILMGAEHERIHFETSAVIMRQVPLKMIRSVPELPDCPLGQTCLEKAPKSTMIEVEAWKGSWERKKENPVIYGWDNQFGEKQFEVPAFKASNMLVTNAEYLEFVLNDGYQKSEYWTEEGKKWIAAKRPEMPLFWQKSEEKFLLRTITRLIDMPWDWPVEINNLEARAFCNWKTEKTGTYTRLPTEGEYQALRSRVPVDIENWEYQSVGNVNWEYWMSPCPVNTFKTGEFYDLVGNVWQHTITPIYPFSKFDIHPNYEDFTTPCFDGRHDIIKGGSFLTSGSFASQQGRVAFRRHFYQCAGFRYVHASDQIEVDAHQEVITDCNVQTSLKFHYMQNDTYLNQAMDLIRLWSGKQASDKTMLTVGCSVGRMPMELGQTFKDSFGIDYTSRYFQMSSRLKQTNQLRLKDIDIDLRKLKLQTENVHLFQMNPQNPDPKKIHDCDWVFVDGVGLRAGTIQEVLGKIVSLVDRHAHVMVLSVSGVNEVSVEQARKVLRHRSDGDVEIRSEVELEASKKDTSYLPLPGQSRKFTLSHLELVSI